MREREKERERERERGQGGGGGEAYADSGAPLPTERFQEGFGKASKHNYTLTGLYIPQLKELYK